MPLQHPGRGTEASKGHPDDALYVTGQSRHGSILYLRPCSPCPAADFCVDCRRTGHQVLTVTCFRMAQTPFTGWILVGYRSQSRSAQHAKPEALERFAPGSRQLTRVGGACIGRLGSPGAGDDSASQDFFFYCRARLGSSERHSHCRQGWRWMEG